MRGGALAPEWHAYGHAPTLLMSNEHRSIRTEESENCNKRLSENESNDEKFPCESQFPGYIAAFVDAQSTSPCNTAEFICI